MIDHVGFEVADLARSARFYDALFSRLGIRRIHEFEAAIAYGSHEPRFWIVAARPGAGAGLRPVRHPGHRPGGGRRRVCRRRWRPVDATTVPPGPRPQYGPRYYAAYLLDPDGLRVEVVAGGH